MTLPTPHRTAACALLTLAVPAHAGEAACSARSAATAVPVVELYTSEGCSSCPPADRWLSRIKAGPEVVALAFHVDYWDRLGWRDRFASLAYTQRQAQQQVVNGARFSYTPQVVVDGADRKDWPGLSTTGFATRAPAVVALELTRSGEAYQASVRALPGAPARLAAFWAITEDGHRSAVQAGENAGATLQHDAVVRDYRPVAPWASAAPAALRFSPAPAQQLRNVNLVVLDAASGRPLQALKLGC